MELQVKPWSIYLDFNKLVKYIDENKLQNKETLWNFFITATWNVLGKYFKL